MFFYHTGDHILKVDGEDFIQYDRRTLVNKIVFDESKSITVLRDGQEVDLPLKDEFTKLLTGSKAKGAIIFRPRTPCVIGSIDSPKEPSLWCKIRKCEDKPESPAYKVGAQVEDKIIAVDGTPIQYYDQVGDVMKSAAGKEVQLQFIRAGDTLTSNPTINADGSFGFFQMDTDFFYDYHQKDYNLSEAYTAGTKEASSFIVNQMKAFGWMFSGKIEAKESLGSFVSITNMFPSKWNWRIFWTMTALLSLILGVLNLMPIPALDGGYVMFLLYEVVTGRKPSDKFMEYAVTAGFILLIVFMVYALGLDIFRLF